MLSYLIWHKLIDVHLIKLLVVLFDKIRFVKLLRDAVILFESLWNYTLKFISKVV